MYLDSFAFAVMSQPVAIVTGAASGLGLAVTKHLITKGYRVMMVDVNQEAGQRLQLELGSNAAFQKCDVSVYADQAAVFAKAFAWGGNRLDFLAANAGIDDRQSLYQSNEATPVDSKGIPLELNMKAIRVDFDAVMQGIWLFKYYARMNQPRKGGKIVITSSAAGLYPMETNPQYSAAKHALVGLTRACGPPFLREDSITVNCICPAFVVTNLCPPHVLEKFPKEHITPMSTVLKAFDHFLDNDSVTGETVELTLDELHFRKQPPWANESQRWLGEDSVAFWEEAYKTVPARTE